MPNLVHIFGAMYLVAYSISIAYYVYDKRRQEKIRKHEELLDRIPCLCGHLRWIHGPSTRNPQVFKCLDFDWNDMCKCNGYHMDNLAYLEKLIEK